jgi:HlyD family secretion protein
VVTIPIQSLVIRTQKDLEEAAKESGHDSSSITLAASRPVPGDAEIGSSLSSSAKNPEIQGVFVIKDGKAEFVPVTTGIMGSTDIEVVNGLTADSQIITGNYNTLRTLKPYARVKIDNSLPKEPNDR